MAYQDLGLITGSKIYTGNTQPDTALDNDIFIDNETWDFYKWVDGTGWVLQGNIKGPQGDTGATGATGATGEKGDKGDPGAVPTFTIDDEGNLIVTQTDTLGVTFSLDDAGHLIAHYN